LDGNILAFQKTRLDLSGFQNAGELERILDKLSDAGVILLRKATEEERNLSRKLDRLRATAVAVCLIFLLLYMVFSSIFTITLITPLIDEVLVMSIVAAPFFFEYRWRIKQL
jgi:hypothetical protein